MIFFGAVSSASLLMGVAAYVCGYYGPVETIAGFGVPSVVLALLAIAFAIKELGEMIQRGTGQPRSSEAKSR